MHLYQWIVLIHENIVFLNVNHKRCNSRRIIYYATCRHFLWLNGKYDIDLSPTMSIGIIYWYTHINFIVVLIIILIYLGCIRKLSPSPRTTSEPETVPFKGMAMHHLCIFNFPKNDKIRAVEIKRLIQGWYNSAPITCS